MVRARKRSIDEVDEYQSDGGFVSNDEGSSKNAPKSKKPKKEATKSSGGSGAKDDDGNPFWQLSTGRNQRRVGISEFKKVQMVNIREYYEKDSKYLPGKKGISLNIDQYNELLKAIPKINASLRSMGVEIEDTTTGVKNSDDLDPEDPADAEIKPSRKVKAKKEKANIEATSDEEEDE
ncbi:transcriptional Coactivator p15 [Phlyctema vagabunda]|uniref:Transcriptional Coactivator p15 n=1 Tax=Phlyctema vagabunda TaxID=108571 RepID=A0ABR4PM27_9HELO